MTESEETNENCFKFFMFINNWQKNGDICDN